MLSTRSFRLMLLIMDPHRLVVVPPVLVPLPVLPSRLCDAPATAGAPLFPRVLSAIIRRRKKRNKRNTMLTVTGHPSNKGRREIKRNKNKNKKKKHLDFSMLVVRT